MSSDHSVYVRPALASDYHSVLEIGSKIYQGLDYMPDMYFWMIQDMQNHPYVAISDGKVVAFNNYRIINNGKTALTMASRVASDYQGRGINETMKHEIGSALCKKYPSLRHRTWTSWGTEAEDRYLRKYPEKFTRLFKWILHQYKSTDVNSFRQANSKHLTDNGTVSLIPLSKAYSIQQEIRQILATHTQHMVFPASGAWVTLELTDTNLRHVIQTCEVIASFTPENALAGISFSNTMKVGRHELSLCKSLSYYGSGYQGDLVNHIGVSLRHLAEVVTSDCGLVGFFMHATSSDVDKKKLAPFMKCTAMTRENPEEHDGREDGLLTLTSIV